MSSVRELARDETLVLDAGGLIAIERRDRQLEAFLARARQRKTHVRVPSTALAQVVRDPARQAALMRLLRDGLTTVLGLSELDALSIGRMLARAGTGDVVDAHVVLCAQRTSSRVVTSDPDDLLRLDPALRLLVI